MEKQHKTINITNFPNLDVLMHTTLSEPFYVKNGKSTFLVKFTYETIEPNKLFVVDFGEIPNTSGKLYNGMAYDDTKKIKLNDYKETLMASKKIRCLRINWLMLDDWNYSAIMYFNGELNGRISDTHKRKVITFKDGRDNCYVFLDELESATDFLKQKHKRKIAAFEKKEQNQALFKATVEPALNALCTKLGISRRKSDGALWVNYNSELEAKIKKAIEDTVNNEFKDFLDSSGAHITFNLSSWSLGRKLGNLKLKNILTK